MNDYFLSAFVFPQSILVLIIIKILSSKFWTFTNCHWNFVIILQTFSSILKSRYYHYFAPLRFTKYVPPGLDLHLHRRCSPVAEFQCWQLAGRGERHPLPGGVLLRHSQGGHQQIWQISTLEIVDSGLDWDVRSPAVGRRQWKFGWYISRKEFHN